MRPAMRMRPAVGAVTRERILRSVDLPAPLRPRMPRRSPACTSKETSFRAQKSSAPAPLPFPRRENVVAIVSRRVA
jgi:hypothetical protein